MKRNMQVVDRNPYSNQHKNKPHSTHAWVVASVPRIGAAGVLSSASTQVVILMVPNRHVLDKRRDTTWESQQHETNKRGSEMNVRKAETCGAHLEMVKGSKNLPSCGEAKGRT